MTVKTDTPAGSFMMKLLRRAKAAVWTRGERRHSLVGPADMWEMKRDFQIAFLKDHGLREDHYLLDLGCGTLRGGIPIIAYLQAGHYVGVEARAEALREGREELAEAGLEHKEPFLVLTSDFSDLTLDRSFDFMWAFSVLIHMNDNILDGVLSFAESHLVRDGIMYANVNMGTRPDRSWKGFPIVWRTKEFYSEACRRNGLDVEFVGEIGDLGHVSGVGSQDRQMMLKITRSDLSTERPGA